MRSPYPPYTRNPYMIRASPVLETYQVLFILCCIVIGFFLVFMIAGIVISIVVRSEAARLMPIVLFYGLIFLCFSFSFIASLSQRRYWQKIEQRRFAAAGRNSSLLASEQPTASPETLHLPCKIEVHMGRGAIVLLVGMILMLALLLSAIYTWVIGGVCLSLQTTPTIFLSFLRLWVLQWW